MIASPDIVQPSSASKTYSQKLKARDSLLQVFCGSASSAFPLLLLSVVETCSKHIQPSILWIGFRYCKCYLSEPSCNIDVHEQGIEKKLCNRFCARRSSVAAPSSQHDLVVPFQASHAKRIANLLLHAKKITLQLLWTHIWCCRFRRRGVDHSCSEWFEFVAVRMPVNHDLKHIKTAKLR